MNEKPIILQYEFHFEFKLNIDEQKNKFSSKTYAIPNFGIVGSKITVTRKQTTSTNFLFLFYIFS